MSASSVRRFGSSVLMGAIWLVTQATYVQAQQRGGTSQTDLVQPVNGGANPYRVIRDWATLTLEERPWGGSNGVAIDRDGKSVWATDRCSPGTTPGCLGTKAKPVHLFDESGKEVRSFGGGMFVWPHGIHIDRDGNVWVTDSRAPGAEDLKKFPGEDKKGSVVVKFSPEGKVLMTLGKPGVRGNPPEALTDPTAVVTDPANGDVYVAESHTDVTDPNLVGESRCSIRPASFSESSAKRGRGRVSSGRPTRWPSIPRAGWWWLIATTIAFKCLLSRESLFSNTTTSAEPVDWPLTRTT
jgi:hypothetical protein